ncbi:MAG: right-handed parallel beta-helix repeat-containing protein [Omnitrophica WOR_2 bacterium]
MLVPHDGMSITQDAVFQPGVYYLPGGMTIDADGITLDGNGALLIGNNRTGSGVRVAGHKSVTIKNLRLQEYYHGIDCRSCQDLRVLDCRVTSTAEVPANTIFQDIWLPLEKAYGGGILLENVEDSQVTGNDLQHQMVGLLTYRCRRLTVNSNNASFCSGWGFHLFDTSDSLYENNCADYCCRYEPRGERKGHMGADAAGFLILYSSCRNIFRRNLARLGGDGFFLGGLSPKYEKVPCNDNLFEENDGSYSPNIAFEATFSGGNIYRNNFANHCNYGFWLGFSRDGLIENNQVKYSAQAGIAVENGFNFQVRENTFEDSGHGILLWSKHIPEFTPYLPENDTSHDWAIENNLFTRNNKAIRIAANQDHGIRPYQVPQGQDPAAWLRPHDHRIQSNLIKDNRIGIEALHNERLILADNRFEHNVETDIIEVP